MTTPEKPTPGNDIEGEEKEMPVQMEVTETTIEKEDPFSKGRERIEAIGNFFSRVKEKAQSIGSRAGATLSRIWNKTKSVGGEAVAATLSADVLAKKGAEYVGQKADQVDTYVSEKVYEGGKFVADKVVEGGQYVGDKVAEGAEYVGQKATEGAEYVGQKATEAKEWAGEKVDQFSNFAEANYEKASQFVSTKAEQLKDFGQEKVELAKDLAFYAKEKTSEGLSKAKVGIENRYNKVKAFGENAMMAAKLEVARRKEAYRTKMNELRQRRLQAAYEAVSHEESETSARAIQLQQQKAKLAEMLGLQNDLGNVENQVA